MTEQKLRRCKACMDVDVLGVVFLCHHVVGSKPRIHVYVSKDKTIEIQSGMGGVVARVNGGILARRFNSIMAAMSAAVKYRSRKDAKPCRRCKPFQCGTVVFRCYETPDGEVLMSDGGSMRITREKTSFAAWLGKDLVGKRFRTVETAMAAAVKAGGQK